MQSKVIPVITRGYTKKFFEVHLNDEDMSLKPHIQIPNSTDSVFALELWDDGLTGIGIKREDYLLFSTNSLLKATGQIALIRQEEEYIIREAHWSGDITILRTPNDIYEKTEIPTENIRIVAVLDNVIKPHENLQIITFE